LILRKLILAQFGNVMFGRGAVFCCHRIPKFTLVPLLSVLILARGALAQPSPTSTLCPADLSGSIASIIDQPNFQRGRWGVLVQTQAPIGVAPTTLYQRDADKYFIPASNAKLITTAAALQQFGPQFKQQTGFYGEGNLPNLRRLVVVGRGDPGINQAKLMTVARQLYQAGVRQIDTLIADDGYFGGEAVNHTWEQEDIQAGYGAPINSLIVDQNSIDLTLTPQSVGQPLKVEFADPSQSSQWQIDNQTRTVTGNEPEYVAVNRDEAQQKLRVMAQLRAGSVADTTSVAVAQPGQFFLAKLQQALRANQIQVGQAQLATSPIPVSGQPLVALETEPLTALLTEVNQASNNLYAEVLLRWIGLNFAQSTQPNGQGVKPDVATAPATAGLTAIPKILSPLGVDAQGFILNDGSGLSRRNLVSPMALVQVLQAMQQSHHATLFRNSLTVAGRNGTLKSRLVGSAAAGQLQGKTGTLTDAVSLSGYLSPPNFSPLVFSIMVNQTGQPTADLRQAIDQIVLTLTRLRTCGS
jgi:D-alanyl-D-alanine carboxypeptidase/D-alanyl-D-alanine-endopeptidase (penicillin-binding protein 4)